MARVLPKVSGIGFLYTEPYVFIWLIGFLIFLNLTFSASISNVYFQMTVMALIVFAILHAKGIKIGLNSEKGNSFKAIVLAGFFWLVFMIFVIVVMGLFQNVFAASPTFTTFLEEHSTAFLGSTQVLAQSKNLSFFVFAFLIPIIETMLTVGLVYLGTHMFNVPLGTTKFGILKNPKIWAIITIVATFVTWLHIQAKGIGSDITLMMVFLFFFITGVVAVLPLIGEKREGETAVWMHIVNNAVAVAKTLRFI